MGNFFVFMINSFVEELWWKFTDIDVEFGLIPVQ